MDKSAAPCAEYSYCFDIIHFRNYASPDWFDIILSDSNTDIDL